MAWAKRVRWESEVGVVVSEAEGVLRLLVTFRIHRRRPCDPGRALPSPAITCATSPTTTVSARS